jgi:hypothetical protein
VPCFSFLVLDFGVLLPHFSVSVRMFVALTWSVHFWGFFGGFCSLLDLDEVLGLLPGFALVVL